MYAKEYVDSQFHLLKDPNTSVMSDARLDHLER